MNIKWNNVTIAMLGLAAVIFALRHKESCEAALDSVDRMGASNSMDDRFVGFMVLGLIGVVIVAIVKILTHPRPDDRQRRRDDLPED